MDDPYLAQGRDSERVEETQNMFARAARWVLPLIAGLVIFAAICDKVC
jgi:hypothetical protein